MEKTTPLIIEPLYDFKTVRVKSWTSLFQPKAFSLKTPIADIGMSSKENEYHIHLHAQTYKITANYPAKFSKSKGMYRRLLFKQYSLQSR